MGVYSDWLTHNIPDPTRVNSEVYLALSALDDIIDIFTDASGIAFSDDSFFSASVADVAAALREIGDYLASSNITRRLVAIPSVGAALVNATQVFTVLAQKDGVLGIGYIYLDTAPVGAACDLIITKNGATMYSFSLQIAEQGPVSLDLSFISVVAGDRIGLYCSVASGAAGLSCSVEI